VAEGERKLQAGKPTGKTRGKYSQRKARHTVRKRLAIELRLKGYGYEAIGRQLRCSLAQAYRLVAEALRDSRDAAAESGRELRELENRRLDQWLAHIVEALGPDPTLTELLAAVDRVVKIGDRRAKLEGLDKQIDQSAAFEGLAALFKAAAERAADLDTETGSDDPPDAG
jgi:hypothetical protein